MKLIAYTLEHRHNKKIKKIIATSDVDALRKVHNFDPGINMIGFVSVYKIINKEILD
jgi:hypothetical protein